MSAIESAFSQIISRDSMAVVRPEDPDVISALATFIAALYLRTPQGPIVNGATAGDWAHRELSRNALAVDAE